MNPLHECQTSVTLQITLAKLKLMNLQSILCLGLAMVTLTACATDTISDRQTGQLIVCHKQSKTLTVSNADSFVHLDHGDSPGPCPEEDAQD